MGGDGLRRRGCPVGLDRAVERRPEQLRRCVRIDRSWTDRFCRCTARRVRLLGKRLGGVVVGRIVPWFNHVRLSFQPMCIGPFPEFTDLKAAVACWQRRIQ
jgi:hypothetical protein